MQNIILGANPKAEVASKCSTFIVARNEAIQM